MRTTSAVDFSLDFPSVFQRLRDRGVPIGTVIDIGASNGCWTEKARAFFPKARYHLIEANEVHRPALEEFAARTPHTSFTLAAAGERVGEVYFDGSDAFGGQAAGERASSAHQAVPCTTVDEEVRRLSLEGPFLLKLDTHGFELPILEGARETLAATQVLVIETYNFRLTDDSLMFWELCAWLDQRGFRPMDLMEPLLRPKDLALWQFDLVFLRAERPEFGDRTYA